MRIVEGRYKGDRLGDSQRVGVNNSIYFWIVPRSTPLPDRSIQVFIYTEQVKKGTLDNGQKLFCQFPTPSILIIDTINLLTKIFNFFSLYIFLWDSIKRQAVDLTFFQLLYLLHLFFSWIFNKIPCCSPDWPWLSFSDYHQLSPTPFRFDRLAVSWIVVIDR